MKKIFVSFGVLALGLGAFAGLRTNKAIAAGADFTPLSNAEVTEMKTMMGKYINNYGRYTKKSHIYLKTSTPDFATYFHAGHTVQERTTYYNEGALLMGDLNGGFTNINSGYANSGENMVHFRSEDGVAGLTNPANRSIDYTVEGKQMSDYFFDLHDLINDVNGQYWGKSGNSYFHDIDDLTLDENGDYNDPVLKEYQYFAAPMLLQTASHYLSFKSIVVEETSGYLHISIYLSESDSGKVDSGSNLLAEAMVYAGLQTPGYYLVGSYNSDFDWQIESGRPFGAGDEENLAILTGASLPRGEYKVCQLKDDGFTTWYGLNGSSDSNNMVINVGGTFNFYLSKNEGTYGHIYKSRTSHENVSITFKVNVDTHGQTLFLIGGFNDWTQSDAEYQLTWGEGNNWSGTFTFEGGNSYEYKFFKGDGAYSSGNNRSFSTDDSMTIDCGSWNF